MYFQRHALKQNFEAQPHRQPRQHSEAVVRQQVCFASTAPQGLLHCRQPLNELHLTNMPYTGLANVQVFPTYVQHVQHVPQDAKEQQLKFRPPSHNLNYRPLIPPSAVTPRANNSKGQINPVAQSRQRSTDENSDYQSNILQDNSDTLSTKVIRKNGLKTVTKPKIPLCKNQSLEKAGEANELGKLRSELERNRAKSKHHDEVLRQKNSALEEIARLKRELEQRDKQRQSLQLTAHEWQSKHRLAEEDLAKSKQLAAEHEHTVGKLTAKLHEARLENTTMAEQLTEMRRQLPEMLQRFERLERLNRELEERIRSDEEEWREEKSRLEGSTLSQLSRK